MPFCGFDILDLSYIYSFFYSFYMRTAIFICSSVLLEFTILCFLRGNDTILGVDMEGVEFLHIIQLSLTRDACLAYFKLEYDPEMHILKDAARYSASERNKFV